MKNSTVFCSGTNALLLKYQRFDACASKRWWYSVELINQIERKVSEIVNNFLDNNTYSYTDLKNQIILELHPFINELTGRRPIILPVIMEVKEGSNYD